MQTMGTTSVNVRLKTVEENNLFCREAAMHRYRIIQAVFLAGLIAGMPLSLANAADEKGGGLTLTIRCDQTGLKAGDEIPIAFSIKNDGGTPCEYMDRSYDRSGRMEEYKLSATGQDGKPIPDPRAKTQGRLGGGVVGTATLQPGQSFTKTIASNRWALVTKPGTYHVTATYYHQGKSIVSAPIDIVIQPRTDLETVEYINTLAAQLKSLKSNENNRQDQEELIQKLVFTCDGRIVPVLIDAMYEYKTGNAGFWVEEALSCYLPPEERTTAAMVDAASEHGMANGMFSCLKIRGCPRGQIKKLIAISLAADHRDTWGEGALAAQEYCDDAFTSRLIAIATDKQSIGRDQSIFALAINRTDESVGALKRLLEDREPRPFGNQSIGQEAAAAIRDAYLYRGNSEGRKLRPDDFGVEYQHPQ
jgi:hypothetical protein